MKIVLVGWQDATNASAGWMPENDVIAEGERCWANLIWTAGVLVQETPEYRLVAVAKNPMVKPPDYTGVIQIPVSLTRHYEVLKDLPE